MDSASVYRVYFTRMSVVHLWYRKVKINLKFYTQYLVNEAFIIKNQK